MKKLLAIVMLAGLCSTAAQAGTVYMDIPRGETSGSYGGFTYTNFVSIGSSPVIQGLSGFNNLTSSVSYDAGRSTTMRRR